MWFSPAGREGELQLVASERSLSTKGGGNLTEGTTFVGRRQVDTLFTFSVDVDFEPRSPGEEAGVTVYLDEARHIDLGIFPGRGRRDCRRAQGFQFKQQRDRA